MTDRVINKKKYKVWTQGQVFDFHEGDIFHNSKIADDNWDMFLKTNNPISLQITNSISSGMVTDVTITINEEKIPITKITSKKSSKSEIGGFKLTKQKYDHGLVTFDVLMPDKITGKMSKKYKEKLKQSEFVTLLQTGTYFNKSKNEFVFFTNNGKSLCQK